MFWILVVVVAVAYIGYNFFTYMNKENVNKLQNQSFQKEFEPELDNFRREFTNQQKAAVLGSMMIISSTSTGISEVEGRYVEQIAENLKIAPNDAEFLSMPQKGRAHLVSILNTLSKSNKEWFAYSLYTLLAQKGKPEEKKLQIALTILSDIGITEDEFVSIVNKSKAINQRFKL